MLILVYKGTMMLFEKIGVLQTDAFFQSVILSILGLKIVTWITPHKKNEIKQYNGGSWNRMDLTLCIVIFVNHYE